MDDRSRDGRWVAVAAATALLVVASVLPSPFDRRPSWEPVGPDTLLHVVGHAGHAALLARTLAGDRRDDRAVAALAACVSAACGLATGRLQRRVPGRRGEPTDVAAGSLGAAVAALGWYLARRRERTDWR